MKNKFAWAVTRFLLHTLPPGSQGIRYFGFLTNRFRQEKLALCCQLLHGIRSDLLPPATCRELRGNTLAAVPPALPQMPNRPRAAHSGSGRLSLAYSPANRFLVKHRSVRSLDYPMSRASGHPRHTCLRSRVGSQSLPAFAADFPHCATLLFTSPLFLRR